MVTVVIDSYCWNLVTDFLGRLSAAADGHLFADSLR